MHGGSSSPARTRSSTAGIGPRGRSSCTRIRARVMHFDHPSGELPALWCSPSMFCVTTRAACPRVRALPARDDRRSVRRPRRVTRRSARRAAHLGIRHVVVDVRQPLGLGLWSNSLRPAKSGIPDRSTCRRQSTRRRGWTTTPRRARVRSCLPLRQSILDPVVTILLRRHRRGRNDSVRRFMRLQSGASAGECGFRKPGVRRDIALVSRRPLSAATNLGDVSGYPHAQHSNRGLLAQGG